MLTARHIDQITSIAKQIAPDGGLHNPSVGDKEREYLNACIDTNEVSSVGAFVLQFEKMLRDYTGAKHAIPVVNGTAALTLALKIAGVKPGDKVITQALTFIGTCNAIAACGAVPVFCDVDLSTGGMSAESLSRLRGVHASAIVPVDVMGFPCDIASIKETAEFHDLPNTIPVVEDAAEALGSFSFGEHCGVSADVAILSFNGNKTITTGGGGAILTNNSEWADKARHLSTQAKLPHRYEYEHDVVANNLRMPNINAALGCAQMERIDEILAAKKYNFDQYKKIFDDAGILYLHSICGAVWNHWLITFFAEDLCDRNRLLEEFNSRGVKARPLWKPLNKYGPYSGCYSMPTPNAEWLYETAICLPSGVRVC